MFWQIKLFLPFFERNRNMRRYSKTFIDCHIFSDLDNFNKFVMKLKNTDIPVNEDVNMLRAYVKFSQVCRPNRLSVTKIYNIYNYIVVYDTNQTVSEMFAKINTSV